MAWASTRSLPRKPIAGAAVRPGHRSRRPDARRLARPADDPSHAARVPDDASPWSTTIRPASARWPGSGRAIRRWPNASSSTWATMSSPTATTSSPMRPSSASVSRATCACAIQGRRCPDRRAIARCPGAGFARVCGRGAGRGSPADGDARHARIADVLAFDFARSLNGRIVRSGGSRPPFTGRLQWYAVKPRESHAPVLTVFAASRFMACSACALGEPRATEASEGTRFRCESDGSQQRECTADTSDGITLVKQLSKSRACRDATGTTTATGVWVSHRCGGEFLTGSRPINRAGQGPWCAANRRPPDRALDGDTRNGVSWCGSYPHRTASKTWIGAMTARASGWPGLSRGIQDRSR